MICLLLTFLWLGTTVWFGGAITGQIWMARAQGDPYFRLQMLDHISWTISRVYIPAAVVAALSLIGLVLAGTIPQTIWLWALGLAFIATNIVGSIYSLPEYRHILGLVRDGADYSTVRSRIARAATVNRIELTVLLALCMAVIWSAT